MKDGKAKAKRYKKHAQEIRCIAEDVRGDGERIKLLAAAKAFEQLAAEKEDA